MVRAGYRAPHLAKIARDVAAGRIDPEAWRSPDVDDDELRDQLLELPGIGPYAADNLLRLLGHYGYLGLDSWCRGKLKRLYPRIRDVDAFAAPSLQAVRPLRRPRHVARPHPRLARRRYQGFRLRNGRSACVEPICSSLRKSETPDPRRYGQLSSAAR